MPRFPAVLLPLLAALGAARAEVPGRCYPFASVKLDGLSYSVFSCCMGDEARLAEFVAREFKGGRTPAPAETPLYLGAVGWAQCDQRTRSNGTALLASPPAPLGLVYADQVDESSASQERLLAMLDNPGWTPLQTGDTARKLHGWTTSKPSKYKYKYKYKDKYKYKYVNAAPGKLVGKLAPFVCLVFWLIFL